MLVVRAAAAGSARSRPRGRRPSRADARARRRADSGRPGARRCRASSSSVEAGGRAVHHRRGDRVVERHHRVVGHPLEQAVEREDLRPVGVLGRAPLRRAPPRSPPAAGTGRPSPAAASRDQRDALGDGLAIPQRADPARRAGSARRPARSRAGAARRSAASARAGRRPPASSGSRRCTARVSRIASFDRSVRCSVGPALLA